MLATEMEEIRPGSQSNTTPSTVDTYQVITDVQAYQAYLHLVEELLRKQQQEQQQQYDIREDFGWFASGQLDTSIYKGKYIAIWRKQVVGSGDTAIEAERLAKFHQGDNCRPAMVYIPEDPLAIL